MDIKSSAVYSCASLLRELPHILAASKINWGA
jgi:hypothetical protein